MKDHFNFQQAGCQNRRRKKEYGEKSNSVKKYGWNFAFVALALLIGLLLVPGGSAIKVTPQGHITTLTPEQDMSFYLGVLDYLHMKYPNKDLALLQDEAKKITERKIVIKPKDADNLTITVTEDAPGEIGHMVPVGIYGDTIDGAVVEMKRGDGLYHGPPALKVPWIVPTVDESGLIRRLMAGEFMIFEGTPSTNEPMKLHINLHGLKPLPPMEPCSPTICTP